MTDSNFFHQLRLLTPADPPLKSAAAAVEPRTCFVSERRPNKTAFLLVWWVRLCRDASLWGEPFIRSAAPPTRSLPTPRPHINNLCRLCHECVRACVEVYMWFGGLWKAFPLCGPCFHFLLGKKKKKSSQTSKRVVWAGRLCWWLLCREYLDSQMLLATFFSSMVAGKQTNWRFWS